MAIQPADLGASVAKSIDRDVTQQARQGAPTGDDQAALANLSEVARKQVRQKNHPHRVTPRRDANQDGSSGRQRHKGPARPIEADETEEEHHFDALA